MLSKGFEVEIYTGTPQGEIVGLSDRIVADLDGFVREPDSRNVEYTTAPAYAYEQLLCDLVLPRLRLRNYLKTLGRLHPHSLAVPCPQGGGEHFQRSDPHNPYHTYIERTYGTNVVTASIHINIGIRDPETPDASLSVSAPGGPLIFSPECVFALSWMDAPPATIRPVGLCSPKPPPRSLYLQATVTLSTGPKPS